MNNPLQIGNFTYSKDENGSWIYKANDPAPLASNKEAVYKEKPLFDLQLTIENNSSKKFEQIAKNNIIEIAKYLKENLK
jgi:hypothetical protein